MPSTMEVTASVLFAIAVIHTFSVPVFARLADRGGSHSGLWHLLSEVEAVFGVWACILVVYIATFIGLDTAIEYMNTRNFTEPAFVFVIMVVAASRPILELVSKIVNVLAAIVPLRREYAMFFIIMSAVPLAGSLITEPAAMTLAALMIRDRYFENATRESFKYLTLGVLFVNISIGGVLTAYAAPPVLMVAQTFNWDTMFMFTHFGWRAATAVIINAALLTFISRESLVASGASALEAEQAKAERSSVPLGVIAIHLLFLLGVVLSAHYPIIFLALLMLFVGYTQAYSVHQNPLMIREGLMVGFFLAGLVVLGGLQKWWLQDLLGGLSPAVLFWGATALTAITDNAALTYLGSLVEGTGELWRYMLVAGAVTGGGLTVIANAPNPAGFSILKGTFANGAISPLRLLGSAAVPTIIAAVMFLLPTSFV
ncbi:putative Na+/H+ antiporter [Paenalcaligenes niemegkensis]|uniref:putative Na+/H+ antiporter n=1 Tax=Paenalcaligenes niemegkensis TaxID=2895469 RepID=UPI001EE82FDB|nr:putative Na+/H+ antiporter [Paenalcaligenes niemegkensis]MCQ9617732.1 putative Na+/H+ antiporter [Paenalcaligenes niemegkensis]